MRVGARVLALWCLLMPAAVFATEQSPHELYDAINGLTVDPSQVYRLVPEKRIELRRGDAVIALEEGTFAFFSPLHGRITGAVFSGRGHVLAAPRDPVEKQQMGRFLGSPVLDEAFGSAYLRFTDGTADELLLEFRKRSLAPQTDTTFLSQWEPTLARINENYTLRVLIDFLSPDPRPAFFAWVDGVSTGPFDIVVDGRRDEQFLLGQTIKNASGTFYDTWMSHRLPDSPARPVAFRSLHYALEPSILSNNSLDATAVVEIRAETGKASVLAFELSRALTVDRVTGDHGEPLAFFQNEGLSVQQRGTRGDDFLYVMLGSVPPQNQILKLQFHYRGSVIKDAGNGVLFVGARESWYPHLGDPSDFATYDLIIRWPRRLRLVATGLKLDEHEEGEFRVGHWRTEKPVAVAGFNLGEYVTFSVASPGHSIEVYANRELEENLKNRLLASQGGIPIPSNTVGAPSTRLALASPPSPPSPADALKQLAKEIDSSVRFYETFSGPFPFQNLASLRFPELSAKAGQAFFISLLFLSSRRKRRCVQALPRPARNTSPTWFPITRWRVSGGVMWLAGRATATSGSMRPSPTISPCFLPTRVETPNTRCASGFPATAVSSPRNRPMPTSQPPRLGRLLSACASTPQNRPRLMNASSTAKALGSFTCSAKCFVSQAAKSRTSALPLCFASSPTSTPTAPSLPTTFSMRSNPP